MGLQRNRCPYLLFADSGEHHRHDRSRGSLFQRTSGNNQLHPVPALPQDLGHLVAAHAEQVGVSDSQDVVPAAQAAILWQEMISILTLRSLWHCHSKVTGNSVLSCSYSLHITDRSHLSRTLKVSLAVSDEKRHVLKK